MEVRVWKSFTEMADWLQGKFLSKFVLTPGAAKHLIEFASKGTEQCAVLGGESGLSNEENALLVEKGFVEVSLGSNILTARTAAIASATILSANTYKKT